MDRRSTLALGVGALGLAAFGGAAQAQSQTRLRAFWWGNPDRDRRTKSALESFAKTNNLQIATESTGWGDYWTKLATQTAGGNAPDLIQMDYRYIFEYARRGALLDLGRVMPSPLDLGDFSPAARDAGKVDGKLYGVTLGTNSKSAIVNLDALERVGVRELPITWTWDDFARITAELSKLEPGKFWGSSDNSRWEQGLEHWLNQRGKLLYTEEGRLGFAKDDVAAWYAHWDKLRKAGSIAPPDVGATNTGSVDQYEVTRGLAAFSFANSNQILAFQSLNKARLAISIFPNEPGAKSGHYIKPAMLMSLSARGRNTEAAARVVNFLVNEKEGVETLGIERGVPGSARAQTLLVPGLDALGRMQVDYVAAIEKVAVPLPPPPPKGAGEIERLMLRVSDAVAFGRTSVRDGATQFYDEARAILERG